jgi:hypothetical protein
VGEKKRKKKIVETHVLYNVVGFSSDELHLKEAELGVY